jgi:hypothetical protein
MDGADRQAARADGAAARRKAGFACFVRGAKLLADRSRERAQDRSAFLR